LKAAAYVRYSSDNQREESIDAQIRAINEYAEREHHTIVKIYADEARSATTDNRPEFQHMMADAPTGLFECVIVHKLDRFSRDRYDSAYYKRLLKKNNIRLLSVLENLNDSPESIILESVLEGMAEYYSRNLAREVMKGMKETAYQCKHAGGTPPLGYDVASDKSYVINETEAESVRMIFSMYSEGHGYGEIIDALNGRGFRTKLNKPFGKNSLHEILKNEKYAGVYVFNKTERKIAGARNGHKYKAEDEVIRVKGGIPAIVSEAMWTVVQNRMSHNLKGNAANRAKTVYILSGRIFCGSCKGAMVGKQGRTGRNKMLYAYYECSTRKRTKQCDMKPINKDVIESMVIDCLYENLFSPDVIDKVTEKFHSLIAAQLNEIPDFIKATKNQLAGIDRELAHIVNAVTKGLYSDELKEKNDSLQKQKAVLKISLEEADFERTNYFFSKKQIHGFLAKYSRIKDMTLLEKKKAVEIFVDRVVVYNDDVYIRLSFDPEKPNNKKRETASKQGDLSFCDPTDSWDTMVEANRAGSYLEQEQAGSRSEPTIQRIINILLSTYRHIQ
jgi:Site-specific recombinases, DNA invertase Pin homologs